jgi:succinyl-CoA synthetase beta subunit
MLENEIMQLLLEHGIACPPFQVVHSENEVFEKAEAIGFPLVMKVLSPDIWHKTDVGGVKLGVRSKDEAVSAYQEILQQTRAHLPEAQQNGVILYPQVSDGLEVIIGVTQDVSFGPVIMFGLGGIFVEVLKDITFRSLPILEQDALEMIEGIKSKTVLDGWRGQQKVDKGSLVKLLCQVSDLVEKYPDIQELDLNPVRHVNQDWIVLDAKVKVERTV